MRPFSVFGSATILLAAGALFTGPAPAQTPRATVSLELSQQFYYAGDSLNLRISVGNPGADTIDNPIDIPLIRGFRARTSDGKQLETTNAPATVEASRPSQLSPQSFYGGVIDLAQVFPQLREIGSYEVYWSGGGIVSDLLSITIIPRYDPSKDYVGEIVTDHGTIVLDLYQDRSPIAVKSFIDMAHSGFYDGLAFGEIHADDFIVGGDPRFVSPPRKSISFPTELSPIPLVAGTVALKPMSASPPANGSAFVITLKPQPAWTGQFTVLGQVVKGLDVVQKISKLPNSTKNSRPYFKPLEMVLIRKVTIREKPATGAP